MSWVEHLSLLSGPLPLLITIGAFGSLVAAIAVAGWRGTRRLVMVGAASLGLVVAAARAIDVEHLVRSSFPRSFFVWAALPVFALAVAVIHWGRSGWARRATSLASVVLLVAFGLNSINGHYAYVPTVGDALGGPVEDQVALTALRPHGARAPDAAGPRGHGGHGDQGDHGEVVAVAIPGVVSHFHARDALVWLPPAYFTSPRPTLPVILVLAGVPGAPTDLIRGGQAVHVADRYAASHGGLAPILVFADANGGFLDDTECVDGPRGLAETYVMTDVRTYVETQFGASPQGSHWGLLGYSEGGTCAVTLALRHPDRFAAFLDISGDLAPNAGPGRDQRPRTIASLYGGDPRQWSAHDPLALLRAGPSWGPAALFAAGTDDRRTIAITSTLAAAAQRSGLRTTRQLFPGGHDFAMVHHAIEAMLPVLADLLAPTGAPLPGPTP